MHIVRLPPGEAPEADVDCITVQQDDDGFVLTGTVLLACGDGEEAESVSLVGGDRYPSHEEAEAAGLAWLRAHGATQAVVSTRPFSVGGEG